MNDMRIIAAHIVMSINFIKPSWPMLQHAYDVIAHASNPNEPGKPSKVS